MAAKKMNRKKANKNGDALLPPVTLGGLLGAEPVMITVSQSGGGLGEVSLITRGLLASMDDGWGLCFCAVGPAPEDDQFTYLLCEDNTVTISRIGESASTVVHRARETYVDSQETPEGMFQTRIFTNLVQINRRGRTGRIRLSYQISQTPFPHAEMYSQRLDIRFRPCK